MKFTVKGIDVVKGSSKLHFEGAEIEMSAEEIALHFEHLPEMKASFEDFADRTMKALEAAKTMQLERHQHRMEEIRAEDERDAAYMQRRKDQEVMEHQHWLEKYGKEDNED